MVPKTLSCFSKVINLVRKWYFLVVSPIGTFWWFPQLVLFGGFPAGNKGVFRTTGDRGRNFLGGLWIPYGYPKISDPLQNRRLLPLKQDYNQNGTHPSGMWGC